MIKPAAREPRRDRNYGPDDEFGPPEKVAELEAILSDSGPKDPEADWVSPDDAAAFLGCNRRWLQRLEQRGNLEKRFRGRRVEYSCADLAALKAGTPNVHAREVPPESSQLAVTGESSLGATASRPPASSSTALARIAPSEFWIAATSRFTDALINSREAFGPQRPFLTLAEAVEYSGLTRAYLLKRAVDGWETAIDISCGGANAIWRFSREGLGKL